MHVGSSEGSFLYTRRHYYIIIFDETVVCTKQRKETEDPRNLESFHFSTTFLVEKWQRQSSNRLFYQIKLSDQIGCRERHFLHMIVCLAETSGLDNTAFQEVDRI
jgi:hypothetical protein